jgi:hypothetical protein
MQLSAHCHGCWDSRKSPDTFQEKSAESAGGDIVLDNAIETLLVDELACPMGNREENTVKAGATMNEVLCHLSLLVLFRFRGGRVA